MKEKRYYIQTLGCQMNVYDSDRIAHGLDALGYVAAFDAEQASVIVLNTCAVRAKAEQKAFSFLGRLAELKEKNPEIIIAVGGCVAQQQGRRILRRVPHVDLVFGTKAIGRLPDLVTAVADRRCRLVDVEMSEEADVSLLDAGAGEGAVSRFVTIMQGCENFCNYCVVPYVRGPETSRDPDRILDEILRLVESGVKEVTLLGQNVNSYGRKEGLCSFVDLLDQVNRVPGLARIRFTTSHPKDLSDELIGAFASMEKLCNHIHLPVQSGSNPVLKRMNRKYTRETYLQKVQRLRDQCEGMAITSDLIVGFPGETEAYFNETLDLMQRVVFDGVFAFKYSDRTGVPATRFSGKIPEPEKDRRLQALLDLQSRFTTDRHQRLVGETHRVLTEGFSRRPSPVADPERANEQVQWTGRTTCNKIVHFTAAPDDRDNAPAVAPGVEVPVRIERAFSHSLWGRCVFAEPDRERLKGVDSHAA